MIRLLLATFLSAALAGCQCGFDASKLDDIACSDDGDCAPGQYCFEGNCSRLDCIEASDCGDEWAFECVGGRCAPVPCEVDEDCPERRRCNEGLCGGGAPCTLHEECEDGVWCNGDERCDDGTCAAGLPPDCGLDLAPCEVAVCLEETRTCRAEPADDGTPCEDGDPCTGPDTCTAQVCSGGGDACADALACTPGDCIPGVGCVVDPGACAIDGACWTARDEQPGNPCMICDPTLDPLAWSPGPAVPCDDFDDCTADDACTAGVCVGRAYDCLDEGLACTEDVCDGAGGCLHRPAPNTCLIDGACRAPGEPNPVEPCEACDPAADSTGWTANDAAAPLDDGIACTRGACVAGRGVHTADDALCAGAGEVCAVCAGGCAVPPSLTVDCGEGETQPGGALHTCTITGGAAACLACTSRIGMTALVRNDFEPCQRMDQLGWELDGQEPTCDGFDGAIGLDPVGRTTLERYIDTRGFDSVRLCYQLLDVGMGGNDEIEISINTGLFWSQASLDTGGPFSQVDWLSTVRCTDLVDADPAAADNPSLGVRFDANLSATMVAIDDLVIDAWDSAYVDHPGRIVDDDFTACDLGGWTEAGDGIGCPTDVGFNFDIDALEANDAAVAIFQVIDLSDRCDDILLGFSTAAEGGFWPRDFTQLHVDRGAGNDLVWEAGAGSRAEDTFVDPAIILSHHDPDLRFQPAVTIRFDMSAGDNASSQWLDDVWIDGATCRSGDALLTIGAVADAGAGISTVAVSSPVQTTAYLECTWAGVDATAMPAPVVFRY